jgi:hypothetical protein
MFVTDAAQTQKKALYDADKYKWRSGFKNHCAVYSYCRELIVTNASDTWNKNSKDDSTLKLFVNAKDDPEIMAKLLTIMVVVPALTFCIKKIRKTFTVDNLKIYEVKDAEGLLITDTWASDMKMYIYKGLPEKALWHCKPKFIFLAGMARHAAIINSIDTKYSSKAYRDKILELEQEAIEIISSCSRKKGLAFCQKLMETLTSEFIYSGTFYPLMTDKDVKTIAWLRNNSDTPPKYDMQGNYAKTYPTIVGSVNAPEGHVQGFNQLKISLDMDGKLK